MGGKSSPVKVIKKAATSFVSAVGDVGEGVVKGDLNKITSGVGTAFEQYGKAITGVTAFKAGVGAVADLTGATAAQEALQQSIVDSQNESRRQALVSDAMAREEGGDSARVSLNTGKNRKLYNQSATGIAGASNSRGTGVQS